MEQKIFLPLQCKALLPSDCYKVLDTLFAVQKDGKISYSKRNAQFLHLDEAICDQAIQTAIDKKLIVLEAKEGGVWTFTINSEQLEKFKNVKLQDVPGIKLIDMSTEITFKHEQEASPYELAPSMTREELVALMQKIQLQLKKHDNQIHDESKDIFRIIKKDEYNDLPF